MIVPLLITGGVLGSLVLLAPRTPATSPQPAPTDSGPAPPPQSIDVQVEPMRYRAVAPMGNPARDAYLALQEMGFTNVTFAGTSDPDLSRFNQGSTVTFAFTVTGTPRHLALPSWMRITFQGPPGPIVTPPVISTPPTEDLPPLPATPATPPLGIPTAPMTRVQRLIAQAEALLAQGLAAEPIILESVAADLATLNPNSPLVGELLQRAQTIRITRAQGVP